MKKSTTANLQESSTNVGILSGPIDLMDKAKATEVIKKGARLLSLDFYRGLVMVLLMLESTGMYEHWLGMSKSGSFANSLALQFTHADWHGLNFWDFIQPAFMFIAGAAMAFSSISVILNALRLQKIKL